MTNDAQECVEESGCLRSLTFPCKNIIAAYSVRQRGNMSLTCGDTSAALKNRRLFLEDAGIDAAQLVCAEQAHGSRVRCAVETDRGRGALTAASAIPATDAFITDRRGVPLAVFTADCLPVFIVDPVTPAVGVAHAGRRSTAENIVSETVRFMGDTFGTRPRDILVAFGPSIRRCCYEVGQECAGEFDASTASKPGTVKRRQYSSLSINPERTPASEPGYVERVDHGVVKDGARYFIDLIAVNTKQLFDLGVVPQRISDCGVCTSCNREEFFSYRREGKAAGRMLSVIMLKT